MSGDVQPRKRKDKRKRRDAFDRKSEGELSFSRKQSIQDDESSHGVHITKMGSDDVHLHVHHDHGTGGHWCAKIFFFSLLAILFGLLALIILENRGISDLDTPLSESRFSNYFDGWVEEHREEHDDHDPVQASIEEHDEHDEPFEEEEEEEEENSEMDDEAADDEDEEEENEPATEEEEEVQTVEATQEEDDDENNGDNDDGNDATNEEVDQDENDKTQDEEEELEEEEVENEDENNDDDDETIEASQEYAKSTQNNNDDDNDDNEDDEDDNNANSNNADEQDDDAVEESIEPIYTRSTPYTQSNDNNNAVDDDDDAFEEEDDDGTFESLENVVDNDAEELLLLQEKARQQAEEEAKNAPASEENDDDDENVEAVPSWASSLAVKIGVGVALAIVARLVLIRNNPNTNEAPPSEVNMKRRLTIASAEDYEDEEEPAMLPKDEYSDEELEIEEEIEYVEEEEIEVGDDEDDEDEEMPIIGKYVPETFEELNAMYRSKESELSAAAATNQAEKLPEETLLSVNTKPQTTTTPFFVSPQLEESNKNRTLPTKPLNKTLPTKTTTTLENTTSTTPHSATGHYPHTTSAEAFQPTQIASVTDSSKPMKHEASPEYDYQPDDEDIDYDDDENLEDDDEEVLSEEEEPNIDDDDEDISDVDDSELMSRLEAKYGRLPAKEYESDEDPDDPTWTQIKPKDKMGGGPQANNDEEYDAFEEELQRANDDMMRKRYAAAAKAFDMLSRQHPERPAAFLGKAKALDQLAEQQRSNQLLISALEAFKRYLAFGNLIRNNDDFRSAAERCIERMRFLGHYADAVTIHEQIIERFNNEPGPRNQLAVTCLLMNRLADAKRILQNTLKLWPLDGFAQVHYGFVLRQHDKNYEAAIIYLRKGIDSKAPGTQDGRFYFNLGDSLQRLGRQIEALEVYERGAALQLFPSAYQRSLYNEPNLHAQPFWTKQQTTYAAHLDKLERNWQAIRDEALNMLSKTGYFVDETESLRDTGKWQQFELYARGQRNVRNCQKAPITCSLIEVFQAASRCKRGQVKFSVMQPGTHVFPHCGPTNCRLRAHLGLVVPQGTQLRVANKESTWTEGKFLIFDDSFEHEVWHNGSSFRLVLIVDVWHPDLSARQRQMLSAI